MTCPINDPLQAADAASAFRKARVAVASAGLYTVAGRTVSDLLASWQSGASLKSRLPFPGGWLPHQEAYLVEEPDLRSQLYDRKAVRTMEKQALNAMAASIACVNTDTRFADPDRVGLYMGMPTVEEPLPSWQTLDNLNNEATGLPGLLRGIMESTPPMSGLVMLNSTACSHIASQFGITGTSRVFSPWADSGLEAAIEAAWSIVEGENDTVLVGAVAPTINPFLYLNYETQGLLGFGKALPMPGEGAAFVLLQAGGNGQSPDSPVYLSGYARLFEPDAEAAVSAPRRCMEEALKHAGLTPDDIGWILFDPHCGRSGPAAEHEAVECVFGSHAPVFSWHSLCGYLGPAQPVLNIATAAEALREAWRIVADTADGHFTQQHFPLRHVLINASGCRGQFVSLVVSRYDEE